MNKHENPPPEGLGRLGLAYVVGMVLYSAGRAWVVGETLAEYGVRPWIFFVLDAGSAVPLALGQVKILQALRRRNPAQVQQWTIITTLAFIAPYAYLVLGGSRPLPTVAYVVIGLLVAGAAAATAWRIRSERAAAQAEAGAADLALSDRASE
jgi:hypothetical protein